MIQLCLQQELNNMLKYGIQNRNKKFKILNVSAPFLTKNIKALNNLINQKIRLFGI